MKNIFFLFFLFISLHTTAQKRNAVWCFGDSAGIDFNDIANPQPIVTGMDGRGSCASIADTSGNLLFYAATILSINTDWTTRIYNSSNQIIQGCDSITGAGWYNEVITIPKPLSDSLYYVFSEGSDDPYNKGIYFTLVDMSANAGSGQVLEQNIQIDSSLQGDCINAVKHGNGRDWWIISKLSTLPFTALNRFFLTLLTPDSVYTPFIQDLNDGATDVGFQKIIFKPSGNGFMLINVRGFMAEYSFDRCTGQISLIRNIYPELLNQRVFWEGAYSPNGNVFYVNTVQISANTFAYFVQYDLTASNIALTADTLEIFQTPMGNGALRLAPNNKIYFSRAYECLAFPTCYPYPDSARNYVNENLSVINYPDSVGAACDYQPFSFYLGGKRTYYGLPNNPNYSLGPVTGSICDTLTSVSEPVHNKVSFLLYPNPATSEVNIEFSEPFLSKQKLQLFNSLNQLCAEYILPEGRSHFKFSAVKLQQGIYHCWIIGDKVLTKKTKLLILK